MNEPATNTSHCSHGLTVGDTIVINLHLSRWRRFKMWLRRPWRWPIGFPEGKFTVTSVSSNTFQIGEKRP